MFGIGNHAESFIVGPAPLLDVHIDYMLAQNCDPSPLLSDYRPMTPWFDKQAASNRVDEVLRCTCRQRSERDLGLGANWIGVCVHTRTVTSLPPGPAQVLHVGVNKMNL